MAEPETVHAALDQGVLTLTLDHPKANAFNRSLVDGLAAALKRAAGDDDVRCVVLTGAGRFFSAGQDLAEIGQVDGQVAFRQHLERTFNPIILRLRGLEKPIVGAINGPAAGAGLGIALATDIRLASDQASFLFAFSGIGLTTDSGTSLSLPRLLGMARASYMAFTNETLTAAQALEWGLVNQVWPADELLGQAEALARRLAEGPTKALGLTKQAFNRAVFPDLAEALDYEAQLQSIAGRTADYQEGVAAFMEKRPPKFTGR